MTSVLIGSDDVVETEAAHGTVTRHYRQHQKGEETSTNSIASIFAWTRGLMHRAKLDGNQKLHVFCETLERAVIQSVKDGFMTKDLALCVSEGKPVGKDKYLTTQEYIDKVESYLRGKWATLQ